MHIVFLGTGGGGGLPQWNCNCSHCEQARAGRRPTRMEAALAVSADDATWVLLDAPPEIRAMFVRYPFLSPREAVRGTPVRAVVLTHGDVNHCGGLLNFRGPISDPRAYVSVYATGWVRSLIAQNPMFEAVKARWRDLAPGTWVPLLGPADEDTGLFVRGVPVPGKPPTYRWEDHPEATVAVQVRERTTGVTLLYAPIVRETTSDLERAADESDILVFDGTFWSDDELTAIDPYGRSAYSIGHIPVEASLPWMAQRRAPLRVYTHINNTNPLNDPTSEPARRVQAAGVRVAEDGWAVRYPEQVSRSPD